MIIGIEFSKTTTDSGKNYYRIAPTVISNTRKSAETAKLYLGSAFFIGAFLYFAFGVLQ